MVAVEIEHETRVANARPGQSADRSGGNRVDANIFRPEVDCQIPYARLQGGLGDPHDVVVWHDAREPPKVSVSIAPPEASSAAARLASSVKEKAEMTIVRLKFSRLVSAYRPLSSLRSEKPMQWTKKSRCPKLPRASENIVSTEPKSSTSQR